MAYNSRYRLSYKRFNGGITSIDILEKDTSVGSYTTLLAGSVPLTYTFSGDVQNIFAPTLGSGAQINVIARPLTLTNLFTSDAQKFKVNIYNGVNGVNLVWQGFLDAGVYNEPYNTGSTSLSEITLNCNDGMGLLDNINYLNADGSTYYSGIQTIGLILQNCISKLDLNFLRIKSNSNVAWNGTNTTIWTNYSLNNDNFIDESYVPMSCRQVLDSIMTSMGLSMWFKGNDIYVVDPINLHSAAFGKYYDISTYTENASTFGGYLDISNKDVTWFQTGGSMDIIPKMDEINVNYDPYNFCSYSYDFSNSNNNISLGTWNSSAGYTYNNTLTYKNWYQMTPYFIGLRESSADTEPVYGIAMDDNGSASILTIPNSTVVQDSYMQMKVSFEVYVHTKTDDLNIYSSNTSRAQITQVQVPISIQIGGQYFKGNSEWSTGLTGNYQRPVTVLADVSQGVISDVWTPTSLTINTYPLTSPVVNGQVVIGFYNTIHNSLIPSGASSVIKWLLVRDLKVDFIDVWSGKVIENTGVMHKGNISTNGLFKTNKVEFPITTGVGTYGCSKAAYKVAGVNAISMSRVSDGYAYLSGDLLMQNMVSQYKQPRFKLNGTLNAKNQLMLLRNALVKDSTYMGTKAFYIVSGSYDDRNEFMNVEMLECESTRDTIS